MTTSRHRTDDYSHCAALFDELVALAEDDERRAELRQELVEAYLPVAEHIARRFSGRGESHDDLVQVGRLGLINAVDRFDPARGSDFLSYAVPTIMGEIRRYFRDSGWALRVPRRLKELHLNITQATTTLSQRLGRAPTPSELAKHLDVTIDEVTEGLAAGNAYQTVSVDKTVSDESEAVSLADTLGADDADLAQVENYVALRPLLKELPPRERTILTMRFFGNMTQSAIAEKVGLSQMHVSRLLSQTLAALREKLVDQPDG